MNAREKAEMLRQEAIQELLTERQAIDDLLTTLGHGREGKDPNAIKRRGRPPKPADPARPPRADREPSATTPT